VKKSRKYNGIVFRGCRGRRRRAEREYWEEDEWNLRSGRG
jgi:hypothetical protein